MKVDPRAASGRILIAGKLTGTAWRVQPELALSAAHCMRKPLGREHHMECVIEFPDTPVPTTATVVDLDPELDVVLLRLAGDAPTAPYLRLAQLAWDKIEDDLVHHRQLEWNGYGYPDAKPDGLALGGEIEDVRERHHRGIQLHCRQGGLGKLKHASGTAVLHGGYAIALIIWNPEPLAQKVIFARPVDQIVQRFPQLEAPRHPATRLPWEDVFIGALQKLAPEEQKTCAAHAGIPLIAGPDLAERIARRMISEGILATARVLRQMRGAMDPKSFDELMRLAETLWVDGTAASHVAGIVGTADVAVLTTDQDWSAQHHVERGYTVNNRGPKAWRSIVVDVAHEEPMLEAIAAHTRRALERELNATNPADIARRLAHQRPFVALIAGPPRADVIDRLKTEWPDLNVIFMYSKPANTPVPGIRQIGPPPTRPDEDRAEQDKGDAWAILS